MSYFEDYIEDGLCCEGCGDFLGGGEPGFVRYCAGCRPDSEQIEQAQPAKVKAQCPECGKRFRGALAARQHMRDAHGIPLNTPTKELYS